MSTMLLILLGPLVSFFYILRMQLNRHKNDQKLPPGPPALPIIGNLHMLGNLPHQTLHNLAKKYGPIMSMKLGSVPTIILSSPQAAELFLRTFDAVSSNRPKTQVSHSLFYGAKDMAIADYGPYWRSVRKLSTIQLFTLSKVKGFAPMRREELGLLVDKLKKADEYDL